MFKNEMLNSCWIEDIYVILIAIKNKKRTLLEAYRMLLKKHNAYKTAGNSSNMSQVELWSYVYKNREQIINHYENLAV
jgi:hypothetical protein